MWLKKLLSAVSWLALAVSSVAFAQDFKTAAEIMQPAPKKNANMPQYAMAFGKVLARIDKSGVTKFNYQQGKLVSEVLPNSIIGTYLYDRIGKFQGIAYNDGKTIKVTYNADGTLSGLNSNVKARVEFKGKYKAAPNAFPLRGFLAVQNGVSAILNNLCISDDPNGCAVYVPGYRDDGGDEGGSGSGGEYGGGEYYPGPDPMGGGGGSGGIGMPGGQEPHIYPRTGTAYETVAECQQYVCEDGKTNFDNICKIAARSGADRANCLSKSQEYYSKCLPSCERADWSWLSFFNFVWG